VVGEEEAVTVAVVGLPLGRGSKGLNTVKIRMKIVLSESEKSECGQNEPRNRIYLYGVRL
jgi:hypothetical protein